MTRTLTTEWFRGALHHRAQEYRERGCVIADGSSYALSAVLTNDPVNSRFVFTHENDRCHSDNSLYGTVSEAPGVEGHYSSAFGCVRRIGLNGTLTMSTPHYSGHPRVSLRPSSLRMVVMTLRRISKMTAVDQPNNRTPFIAVIGPSKCQRSVGVTSP